MVKYAWIFGRVMVLVEYFEQIGLDEIEGGARVEVRRVEKELIPGAPAAVSGFRVLPVSEGVWRADLFHLLNKPGDRPIYHYHPNFHDGDVGEREFDPGLTGDHLGSGPWSRSRNLQSLLRTAGYGHLAAGMDADDLESHPAPCETPSSCDGGRAPDMERRLPHARRRSRARANVADPV